MRIGIDARLIEETGVGRYIRNLIEELAFQNNSSEYVVFLRAKQFATFALPNTRWTKINADVPWHGVTEQLKMPGIFIQAKLDVLHVPYFNIPVFYPGKIITTIHDLTILHIDTGKATTLPWVLYKMRRIGYRCVLWWGIKKAHSIIAVSEATKHEIIDHFKIPSDRIVVTYEGVDKKLLDNAASQKKQAALVKEPYFLYVGNAYPHKNIEMLLAGFKKSSAQKLVLVGKDDFFYRRLREAVRTSDMKKSVTFFGPASDIQLANLYAHANALVFPSLMEGFGLPAIEALAIGCPVMCSDIPVFHEILGDNALYFDPTDVDSIAKVLDTTPIKTAKFPVTKFSWKTMAQRTQQIYEDSIGI